MIIKCYDYLYKNFVREVNTPILSDNIEDFILLECSKHMMYPFNTTKIKILDREKNACFLQSLHSHILTEYIKNDLLLKSPKRLGQMYKYFKGVFSEMSEVDFQNALYDIEQRFNTIVNTKQVSKTDIGTYKREYKDTPWSEYYGNMVFDSRLYKFKEIQFVNSIIYSNKRINIDFLEIEKVIRHHHDFKLRNKSKFFENSIRLVIKGTEIVFIKGGHLKINFLDVSEEKYLYLLDYMNSNIFQYCEVEIRNPFKLIDDSKDCQEKRQGEIVRKIKDSESISEEIVNFREVFKCSRTKEYEFPGYTKKGTLCCFSLEKLVGVRNIKFPPEYSFDPISKLEYLDKENMSKKLKKNVYIIDFETSELIPSKFPYDIYKENVIILYRKFFNELYILRDEYGNTDIKDKILETSGLKLEYPTFRDIYWTKEYKNPLYKKDYTHEVVDTNFNKTVYLKHVSGAFIPVIPQEYTGIFEKLELDFVESRVQEKFLDSKGIEYQKDERGAIFIPKFGVYIPTNLAFKKILSDINSELYSKLLEI